MTALLGNSGLGIAVLGAVLALGASALGAHPVGSAWLARARWCMVLFFVSLTLSGAALLTALVRGDMRLSYVASHTERALAVPYRIAALWAGQEGSLLLWAWLLGGMSMIAALSRRRFEGVGEAVTLGVLSVVLGFFSTLLLLVANPFHLGADAPPADGHGLNPLLQHWAMVAHPPTLFLGYAGFTIPFAIMVGALAAGRTDNHWVGQLRRWVLVSWLFLGVGIALGAWWAYVELGWGGYWAWDPVENASLLPWLTGTALLHTIMVHQHRGALKGWTACLSVLTFALCIFGTYITRSGVIQSVHAFGESLIGTFFLWFLVAVVAGSAGLIVRRRVSLRTEWPCEVFVGREGVVLAGNIVLLVMAATTLAGTVFPVVSALFTEKPISVGEGFYNRAVAPLGLVCAALMALGPALTYGGTEGPPHGRPLVAAGVGAALGAGAALAAGLHNPTALTCVAISVFAALVMAIAFVRAVTGQVRHSGLNPLAAAVRVIDSNHRRYGGQLAHVGVILLILGVAGSSLFSVTRTATVRPGDSIDIGRYTLRYEGLRVFHGENFTAVEASLTVATAGGAPHDPNKPTSSTTLHPQRRFYDKAEDANAEVAIRTTWRDDLYVALVGWEDTGATAAIQARINPLTLWIWIGAIAMATGGVVCLLPKFFVRSRLLAADRSFCTDASGSLAAQ